MTTAKKKPVAKAALKKTATAPKPVAKKTVAKPAAKVAVKKATPVKKPTPVKKAAPAKAVKAVAKAVKPETKVAAKVAKKVVVKTAVSSDETEKLRDIALRILDERQAEDIVTVDLRTKSALADFAIIATGRSSRQLIAIADYLREAFMKNGIKKIRIEGMEQADWVLFDGGDVIVHLFRPEVRSYYNIEDIWSSRPTKA